jgi:hypothetical protein
VYLDHAFRKMDGDGDGFISLDELLAHLPPLRAAPGSPAAAQPGAGAFAQVRFGCCAGRAPRHRGPVLSCEGGWLVGCGSWALAGGAMWCSCRGTACVVAVPSSSSCGIEWYGWFGAGIDLCVVSSAARALLQVVSGAAAALGFGSRSAASGTFDGDAERLAEAKLMLREVG